MPPLADRGRSFATLRMTGAEGSGNARATFLGSLESMKRTYKSYAVAFLALLLCAGLPAQDQKKSTDVSTPAGKFSLEVTAEYLGMASNKTVVRLRLGSAQLSKALSARGVRFVSGELRGTFSRGDDMVEAFRYPVSSDIDGGKPFTYSFLRAVPPGAYKVKLYFALPGGKDVGEGAVDLAVPELGAPFRPEMAPAEASTLPEAEAIVIADSSPAPGASPESPKLKILPPRARRRSVSCDSRRRSSRRSRRSSSTWRTARS